MAHIADQLKAEGNALFKSGDYSGAEAAYTAAIAKYAQNPLLFTNRALARLKLRAWAGALDDCLHSIDLLADNFKAYYYLAEAQLALNHPHEALSSALTAYEQVLRATPPSANVHPISQLVLKCKRAKWEARERERARGRGQLLAELEDALDMLTQGEAALVQAALDRGEMGAVEAEERRKEVLEAGRKKLEECRSVFAIADPEHGERREVPDWLVDNISFEVMHDPVMTKTGHSYERSTLIEHLKRSPTDPLTREPLTVNDLRPNLALKQACADFLENNKGWVVDW
ncbi:hypothetical protein BJ546DRAFT_968079 [Cryomyces antarcticus]|nr:hypothetical protein LTR04_005373 [Oleoguttula sp. CCFEE 6159]